MNFSMTPFFYTSLTIILILHEDFLNLFSGLTISMFLLGFFMRFVNCYVLFFYSINPFTFEGLEPVQIKFCFCFQGT